MTSIRGASFIEENLDARFVNPVFKKEFVRLNEELKKINLESEKLEKNFGGKILKVKNKKVKFEEFVSKYGLKEIEKYMDKSERVQFLLQENLSISHNKKIPLTIIFEMYNILEEELYATSLFVEMIDKYKKSNFVINELFSNCPSPDNPLVYIKRLYFSTKDLFPYIENGKVLEVGKKMFDECMELRDAANDVDVMKDNVIKKLNQEVSNGKTWNLEQLKQYRMYLEEIDKELASYDRKNNAQIRKKQ